MKTFLRRTANFMLANLVAVMRGLAFIVVVIWTAQQFGAAGVFHGPVMCKFYADVTDGTVGCKGDPAMPKAIDAKE